MENLMESNERTLVMFDAVCTGLAECLGLVHSDIRQMTEQRKRLTSVVSSDQRHKKSSQQNSSLSSDNSYETNGEKIISREKSAMVEGSQEFAHQKSLDKRFKRHEQDNVRSCMDDSTTPTAATSDDPHHLGRLKLLDKRLADTFSQALAICDEQQQQHQQIVHRSSSNQVTKKQQQATSNTGNRASIFQILLGKTSLRPKQRLVQQRQQQQQQTDQSIANDEELNRFAMIEDLNAQTSLALHYAKQLESNLLKIEDLRSQYEIHLKMGLMVKSVSQAYISASSSPSSSPALTNCSSSNSLKKRRNLLLLTSSSLARPKHHTSSLVVNDSSSSLGTRSSSKSSLNFHNHLSSWTSRHTNNKQQQRQQQQKHIQDATRYNQNQLANNHKCVSTISLDSQSNIRRRKETKYNRLDGLANKLISPQAPIIDCHNLGFAQQFSANDCPLILDQHQQQCYCNQHVVPNDDVQYTDYLSPPPQLLDSTNTAATASDPRHVILPTSDYVAESNYIGSHRHHHYDQQEEASTMVQQQQQQQQQQRPLSQYSYGEYGTTGAVPTTMGTLAGLRLLYMQEEEEESAVAPAIARTVAQKPPPPPPNYNDGDSFNYGIIDDQHQLDRLPISENSLKRFNAKQQQMQQYVVPTNANGGKTTIKEFIETISRLETEFEAYMGTFTIHIDDIKGFARVCQGDVFEIQIRYGDTQKLKSKISVLKDNKQKCDNRQTVFKAKISDVIAIRAFECKGLGKRVLLGNKLCDIRHLFTPQSTPMTIDLNQTGSIKLNLIFTWNPIHVACSDIA